MCEADGGLASSAVTGLTDERYIAETQTKKSVIDGKSCFRDAEKHKKKTEKILMKWAVGWCVNTVTGVRPVTAVWYRPVVSLAVAQIVCNETDEQADAVCITRTST